MKLISWNVNGLRACIGKGFLDFVDLIDADVICFSSSCTCCNSSIAMLSFTSFDTVAGAFSRPVFHIIDVFDKQINICSSNILCN